MAKTTQSLAVISEDGLGPAMMALNPMQRAFVVAKVEAGLDDAAASRAAGYADDRKQPWRLAHAENVQAAILEEGRKLMRSQGPKSILTLVAIRDDKTAANKDRLKAATELLNRSGFHIVSEHHEHQHHHLSEAETDRRILALAAELGLAPEQAKLMLVAPAEFERNAQGVYELPEPDPREPEPSHEALLKRAERARKAGKTPEELATMTAQHRAQLAETTRAKNKAMRAEYEAREQSEDAIDAEFSETNDFSKEEY